MRLIAYALSMKSDTSIPTLLARIPAGHRHELESHFERVDLNKMLTGNKPNHLLLHIEGDSMDGDIGDGDWVVMSRDREPKHNDVIVAQLNSEFTIKRFQTKYGHRHGLFLVPTNGSYATTEVTEQDDYEILGVVVYIIKKP